MEKRADITKRFIDKVNQLIESQTVRNKREIVDKLNWNETAMSNVLAGRRPVPEEIADAFFKLYTYVKGNASPIDSGDQIVMMVPLVHKYAYAGYQAGYGDDEYVEALPKVPMIVDKEHKGTYRAFEIRGDSMNNGEVGSYEEGYIAYGRELQQHHWRSKLHFKQWKSFVIVTKTDGILIKEIIKHDVEKGIITLHSWNPDYPDIEMSLDEIAQLFNVVDVKFSNKK